MKVTLKTIRQKTFKVEVDDDASVLDLKNKIEQDNADYPTKQLKLIYSGKILQDGTPLSEYKIADSGFVVVMVSKAKPVEASAKPSDVSPVVAPPQPVPVQSSPRQPTDANVEPMEGTDSDQQRGEPQPPPAPQGQIVRPPSEQSADPPPAPASDPPPGEEGQPPISQASSNLVVGQQYIDAVTSLMAMGYERSQVERAMAASYNNPDRAFEYLESGIPPDAFQDQPPPQQQGGRGPAAQQGPPQEPGEDMPVNEPVDQGPAQAEGRGQEDANPLAFLRRQPQFEQLRRTLQQDPSRLHGLLQELGQGNPQLLQVIQENQQSFLDLINPPQGQGQGQGQAQEQEPGVVRIQLTQEDRAAIDRLMGLGSFDESLAVQVYFACDKDENQAAELLLTDAHPDGDPQD